MFTARKRSCWKVMFSQVSVCPRGWVGISGTRMHSSRMRLFLGGCMPHAPPVDRQTPVKILPCPKLHRCLSVNRGWVGISGTRSLPGVGGGWVCPGVGTPSQMELGGGYHPQDMRYQRIRLASGWYITYWNAVLFPNECSV